MSFRGPTMSKEIMSKGIIKIGKYYHIVYQGLDGKQKWESSRSTKKRDAVALRAKRLLEVREGKQPELKRIPNITLKDFAEEYLVWAKTHIKSYRARKGFVKQLTNDLGNILLNKFSIKLVEQWQNERIERGNKPATVDSLLAVLKHMFTKAYERQKVSYYARNQVKKVKLYKPDNRRSRYLSEEECHRLIDACDDHLRPIVITALHTGMRKSEILSLTWDRVDLHNKVIEVINTKNNESRVIPIGAFLYQTLTDLRTRIDVDYVFHDKNGRSYQDVKKSFASALKRAKITNFRFHDLRHTFASHLVMAGVDIVTVQKLLGHKTLTMTLRYAQLADAHRANAIDKLEARYSGRKEEKNLRKILEM